jgi:hypothetical protein
VADYSKIQNYAAKDSGALDANRLITGTGIDNEPEWNTFESFNKYNSIDFLKIEMEVDELLELV